MERDVRTVLLEGEFEIEAEITSSIPLCLEALKNGWKSQYIDKSELQIGDVQTQAHVLSLLVKIMAESYHLVLSASYNTKGGQ